MNRREFLRLSALGMAGILGSSFFMGTGMAAAQETAKAKAGVIGAMESEVANLKKAMRLTRRVEKAGMAFHEGRIIRKTAGFNLGILPFFNAVILLETSVVK